MLIKSYLYLNYNDWNCVLVYKDETFWMSVGKSELNEALNVQINNGVAKNVILFVGDGMGPNTVTATRIYKHGESGRLTFEKFPHMGLLKVSTYYTCTFHSWTAWRSRRSSGWKARPRRDLLRIFKGSEISYV